MADNRKRDAIRVLEMILHEQKASREAMDRLADRTYWLITEMRRWYKDRMTQPALPLESTSGAEQQHDHESGDTTRCFDCEWIGDLATYVEHMRTAHGDGDGDGN